MKFHIISTLASWVGFEEYIEAREVADLGVFSAWPYILHKPDQGREEKVSDSKSEFYPELGRRVKKNPI